MYKSSAGPPSNSQSPSFPGPISSTPSSLTQPSRRHSIQGAPGERHHPRLQGYPPISPHGLINTTPSQWEPGGGPISRRPLHRVPPPRGPPPQGPPPQVSMNGALSRGPGAAPPPRTPAGPPFGAPSGPPPGIRGGLKSPGGPPQRGVLAGLSGGMSPHVQGKK